MLHYAYQNAYINDHQQNHSLLLPNQLNIRSRLFLGYGMCPIYFFMKDYYYAILMPNKINMHNPNSNTAFLHYIFNEINFLSTSHLLYDIKVDLLNTNIDDQH